MRGRLWSWWLPAERWSRCPSKRWAISRRGNSGGSWPSRCHTSSLPVFHSKDQKISILEEVLMEKMARNWGVTIKDWCVIIKYWNVTIKNCGLSITNRGLSITNRGLTYHCGFNFTWNEMSVKCWLNPRSVPCWITPTLLYELRSRKQRAEQVFPWSFALLNPPCWMVLGLCPMLKPNWFPISLPVALSCTPYVYHCLSMSMFRMSLDLISIAFDSG